MKLEDEKYYETLFDLFTTDGWKLFISSIEQNIEDFSIESLEDEKHLRHVQGQLLVLNNISNFESNIKASYDQIVSEETGDNLHEYGV
jgi:hypothetical protein